MNLHRVCVFCGSQTGQDPVFAAAAGELGRSLLARDCGLVFGGGGVGLMGLIADAVLAGGGEVVGVIPEGLKVREVAHDGVTEMHVVPDMHTRKARMSALSDAFIALPGGYGTLEELFEVVTWAQLGIHRKPIGLLNVSGYFDELIAFIDHVVSEGFVSRENRDLFVASDDPEALLDALADHEPPPVEQWLHVGQT